MIEHKHLTYFCILSILISCILITGCTTTSDKSWTVYKDKSDGIKISHPADWSVTVTKTTPMRIVDLSEPSLTMENVIHIITPDTSGSIQIMGFSYPPTLYSDDGITDDAYDTMINALYSTSSGKNRAISITRDETSYMLNGNSVRKLQATLLLNNEIVSSEHYIVRHDKVYYIISYVLYEPSAEQYSQTATEIIKTFETVEWNT